MSVQMRKPTDLYPLYDWWRKALSGDNPPIHEVDVHLGWFRCKQRWTGSVKTRNPDLPCCIYLDQVIDENGELAQDEIIKAVVNGVECDPQSIWLWACKNPISKGEYDKMEVVPDDKLDRRDDELDFIYHSKNGA